MPFPTLQLFHRLSYNERTLAASPYWTPTEAMTTNTSVRLPKGLLEALAALSASNSASARKAIAALADLKSVVATGAGTWDGPSSVTSFRLTTRELAMLEEAAKHLGTTRQMVLALALGAYMRAILDIPQTRAYPSIPILAPVQKNGKTHLQVERPGRADRKAQ